MVRGKKSVDWFSPITGICFTIVSFVASKNPHASLVSLVIRFGIVAIVKGVSGVLICKKVKNFTRLSIKLFSWISIIDTIPDLIPVFNVESAVLVTPYVSSTRFIIDSIGDINSGRYLRFVPGGLYHLNITINIITLTFGITILYNSLRAFFTVVFLTGMYSTISGVKYIAYVSKHEY